VAAREGAAPGTIWRAARQYLGLQARLNPGAAADAASDSRVTEADPSAVPAPVMSVPVTRFGFTVGKRNARLSVDRNLVRRVLREAARHAAPALDQAAGPDQLDIVLRLKSTLPPKGSDARARLRADLRNEADSLLAQLTHRLAARHATGTTGADNPAGRA
jgi:RNase P protein component